MTAQAASAAAAPKPTGNFPAASIVQLVSKIQGGRISRATQCCMIDTRQRETVQNHDVKYKESKLSHRTAICKTVTQ